MIKLFLSIGITMVLFAACSTKPYSATNKVYKKQAAQYGRLLQQYPLKDSGTQFVGTTNFSMRAPNFIILHYTAQNSCDQTLKTFTMPSTKVSSHYVVCKSGTVFHMLNDYLRGHHAGVSKWGSLIDLNSGSIGIEIDNNGSEPFPEEQISSLLNLLKRLKTTYNIPTPNFLGHADIAPGRKPDPGKYFPWERLAKEGFGVWYDTTNVTVKPGFDGLQALRTIGYNIARPQYAIQAYKLHFNQQDSTQMQTLTEVDNKIITSLLDKF